jgi:transposase-like protein
MDLLKLKEKILSLSEQDRATLLSDLSKELSKSLGGQNISRRELLDNKLGDCAHCGHKHYVRFGMDKGSQRYKCKSCKRSFTEYTGTWMARLRRRDKVTGYLVMMLDEKSLDRISSELRINKKTAFDWRHKILASLNEQQDDDEDFTGITESDETFFLRSEKGMEVGNREPRKRGGRATKRGVSKDQVAVVVTQDRKSSIDISVASLGRIGKDDLERVVGQRIKKGTTILCSDSHHSYKGFAKDCNVEFHPINISRNERVRGVYHTQHVNATHNKLKKWIKNIFWGVSTKYLQQYMNWYKAKERIKHMSNKTVAFSEMILSTKAIKNFLEIKPKYQQLVS